VTHVTVAIQDEETGALRSADAYLDSYLERWGVPMPARRRVVSLSARGSVAREVVLEHHELVDDGWSR
jgi:hypothetical protein